MNVSSHYTWTRTYLLLRIQLFLPFFYYYFFIFSTALSFVDCRETVLHTLFQSTRILLTNPTIMMSLSLVLITLSLLPFLSAAPLASPAAGLELDIQVLQLGLYLEHVEYNFFNGGWEKFSDADFANAGFSNDFRANIKKIADVGSSLSTKHMCSGSV